MRRIVLLFTLFQVCFAWQQVSAQESSSAHNARTKLYLTYALRHTKTDTGLINIYHQLYGLTDSLTYAEHELELSGRLKDKNWYAQALLDAGRYYYFYTDSHDSALSCLKRAVQLAETLGNQSVLANGYRYLGFVFRSVDSYMAEAYYEKSLLICKKMHDDLLASYDYSALGNIYEGIPTQFNKTTALEYYLQSLAIREKQGSYEEIASSLLETSRIYSILGNYNKAFELLQKGLDLSENAGDITNTVDISHLIGNDYSTIFHNNQKALEYQLKAYNLAKTQKNNFDALSDISRSLGGLYHQLGDDKKSNSFYYLYCLYNDSLHVKSNNEVYNLSGAKHSLEVELERQKTIANNAEISKQKAETARQTLLRNEFLLGFGFFFVFAVILYWGYRRQNKSNRELKISNKKIEVAYELIESRNKDITDSIRYASTIQKAILVPKETVIENFKDAFILTLPKDIVSGDFYFFSKDKKDENAFILAACDCTGHGVPGALVSIVSSNALNRTIREFLITEPAKILDKAREFLIGSFDRSETQVQDGMDISLCRLNTKTREMEWSGAYNSLWYIHKNEILEIAADKQPIGVQDNSTLFTNHKLTLEEGDSFYLFSDGYADQFGGPKEKKFTKPQLQELLLSIHNKSMKEQEEILLKTHTEWKGKAQQVDDILIIGVRV